MLLEKSPFETDEGQEIGRDPRTLSVKDFEDYLPNASVGMKAIRAKCLDCSCGSATEVRKCVCTSCPLWPLRMGVQPKSMREMRRPGE